MLQLAVVRNDAYASKVLVFTWEFKRCSNLLQRKTSDITKFMPTCWTAIVNPRFATRTQCVTVGTLQKGQRDREELNTAYARTRGSDNNPS